MSLITRITPGTRAARTTRAVAGVENPFHENHILHQDSSSVKHSVRIIPPHGLPECLDLLPLAALLNLKDASAQGCEAATFHGSMPALVAWSPNPRSSCYANVALS